MGCWGAAGLLLKCRGGMAVQAAVQELLGLGRAKLCSGACSWTSCLCLEKEYTQVCVHVL